MNTSKSNQGHSATQSLSSGAASTSEKNCVHAWESPDPDATNRLLSDGACLYYDPIWTIMHIGRTQDGIEFVHVGDGMSLLISFDLFDAHELLPCSLPEWVYVFDHYPQTFIERAVEEFHPVVVFEGISISAGLDLSGRRFVCVELGTYRHLLLREPDPYRPDAAWEEDIKAILAEEIG
jgi:hypothetical protein